MVIPNLDMVCAMEVIGQLADCTRAHGMILMQFVMHVESRDVVCHSKIYAFLHQLVTHELDTADFAITGVLVLLIHL